MTRFWSILKPGISIGREPVASTTFFAMIVCVPFLPVTVMRWPSGPDFSSFARAVDDLDAVALEQRADAAGQLVDDAALPRLQLLHVERGLARDRDAEVVGVAHLLEHLRGVNDGLRRDAPDVEADAAHVLALDDGGLDLELT